MRMLLAVAACIDEPASPTDTDTGSDEPTFEIVLDQVPGGTLLSAWSDGDDLVMVGGDISLAGGLTANLVRRAGESWCVEEEIADRTLWWIHGPRTGEWYAVGEEGRILHEVDGVRTREDVPTAATLYGVWSGDDGRVWAVGGDARYTLLGEVWLRDGGTWTLFAGDLPGVLFKVWGEWIVGDGLSYRIIGDTLAEQAVPDGARLLTTRGRSDDDVWAVGGSSNPTLLHWEGTDWAPVDVDPHCSGQPLNGVWTAPGEDVWIAGNSGSMGWFDGTTWECSFPPITDESFHAVWKHGEDVFWAGGNLLSPGDNYGTVAHYGSLGPSSVEPCVVEAR